ncbi:APC family permease [Pseudomonas sp. JQ170]|uniref:APC family permease n=1 Tax=unclassified Pseudomonas TaxID=196821 RepID=UPI002652D705|nr:MULTISPECIES: APC family permease [unclassified Pseudomonas]MDN7139726.1 APC family permease [Pseudomonas sp. JQ170]WRO73820.1 APC family permease [Pseudomonas sp. 170C]
MSSLKLSRSLGFWAAYSTSVGLVVSGTAMVALGNGYGVSGPAFSIVALLALMVILCIAMSYSELAAMLPGAGMVGEYTLPALGKLPALFAVLAGYIVLVGTDGGTNMIIGGQSLERLTGVPWYLFSLGILAVLVAINLKGVDLFGRVQTTLAIAMMLMLGLVGVWGLSGFQTAPQLAEQPAFSVGTWQDQLGHLSLAIWLFIGMEFVAPLAEEVKNPGRTIPLAMIFGCASIWLVDLLFGLSITRYLSLEELAASTIPHVDGAAAMLGQPGLILMGSISILAAVTTCDTYLIAVPRMLYGLSREGMLPKIFSWLHPTARTPWFSIFFVVALILIVLVYAMANHADIALITMMISVACTTWLMSYLIAQVNVLVLRAKYPNAHRPFRTPLYPLPQVVGIVACLYMIGSLVADAQVLGIAVVCSALILAFGVIYLKKTGQALFQPVPLDEVLRRIVHRSESLDEPGDGVERDLLAQLKRQ